MISLFFVQLGRISFSFFLLCLRERGEGSDSSSELTGRRTASETYMRSIKLFVSGQNQLLSSSSSFFHSDVVRERLRMNKASSSSTSCGCRVELEVAVTLEVEGVCVGDETVAAAGTGRGRGLGRGLALAIVTRHPSRVTLQHNLYDRGVDHKNRVDSSKIRGTLHAISNFIARFRRLRSQDWGEDERDRHRDSIRMKVTCRERELWLQSFSSARNRNPLSV